MDFGEKQRLPELGIWRRNVSSCRYWSFFTSESRELETASERLPHPQPAFTCSKSKQCKIFPTILKASKPSQWRRYAFVIVKSFQISTDFTHSGCSIVVLEQVNASWFDSGPKLNVRQPGSRTKTMKQIINFQCQKLKQW